MTTLSTRGYNPLRLSLQYFAEGSEDVPVTTPDDASVPTDPPAEPPADSSKTFTQEELDDIVAKRLAREQKKLEKFADYDTLKSELSQLRELQEQQAEKDLSETEKVQKMLEREKQRAEKAEQDLQATQERLRSHALQAAFERAAQAAGIAYVEDAFRLADLSAVEVDEEFAVTGVDEAVRALAESKPFLVKAPPKEDQDIGNPSSPKPPRADKTKEQLLDDARTKALATGRVEDRVAYAKLKRELGL